MAIWLLIAVLALPLAELGGFAWVASQIGFAWALALVLATSLGGMLLIRHVGFTQIARLRAAAVEGGIAAWQAEFGGAAVLLGGVLLLIPGFITDLAAVALLIAPFRRALASLFTRPRSRAPDGVVDLEPQEWRREPEARIAAGENDTPPRP